MVHIKLNMYVVIAFPPIESNETRGLVTFDGHDDYITSSQQTAFDKVDEMQEQFPDVDYQVFKLAKIDR